LADSAELFIPTAVAVDASGNLYIADYANDAIRKVNASTHIITTIAGSSQSQGYTGDGGQATAASLDEPSGIAVDSHGNVYIVDEGNNVIRKITVSTGIITTVVGDGEGAGFGSGSGNYTGDGGPADSASLNGPTAIAVDASDNLYIADQANNVIRKVDGSTHIISTFAGVGFPASGGDGHVADSAGLTAPSGVALDGLGNLFITDEGNNAVRKVNLATHIITTAAGNYTAGFSGDGGIPTSAELTGPTSVAVDATGNYYFTDTGNERVRKVALHATGIDAITDNANISVYPVPANGNLTVKLSGSGYTSLKICDALGREIHVQALNESDHDVTLPVNLSHVANGFYILQITSQTGISAKQILVQK
ncbi:MAG: hypothetical protein JWO06_75, partial [Bacteroidota bacterium]|nr:hypothetical protein [Bacteroidota bacterium]